jgi:hypothetical protein
LSLTYGKEGSIWEHTSSNPSAPASAALRFQSSNVNLPLLYSSVKLYKETPKKQTFKTTIS